MIVVVLVAAAMAWFLVVAPLYRGWQEGKALDRLTRTPKRRRR